MMIKIRDLRLPFLVMALFLLVGVSALVVKHPAPAVAQSGYPRLVEIASASVDDDFDGI